MSSYLCVSDIGVKFGSFPSGSKGLHSCHLSLSIALSALASDAKGNAEVLSVSFFSWKDIITSSAFSRVISL